MRRIRFRNIQNILGLSTHRDLSISGVNLWWKCNICSHEVQTVTCFSEFCRTFSSGDFCTLPLKSGFGGICKRNTWTFAPGTSKCITSTSHPINQNDLAVRLLNRFGWSWTLFRVPQTCLTRWAHFYPLVLSATYFLPLVKARLIFYPCGRKILEFQVISFQNRSSSPYEELFL